MDEHYSFEFGRKKSHKELEDSYTVHLPANIESKKDLMEYLYDKLCLPGYFGFNWDALLDCLTDLHWIDQHTVLLIHADLPSLEPSECRVYLEVLAEAVTSWHFEEEHSLRVIFPSTVRAEVNALLGK